MDRSWATEEGGSSRRPGHVDGSTAWRRTERPAAGWRRSSEVRGACVAAPRWGVRRARPTGVGSTLAVLVAVLALGAAAPARAQTTLVSNFDQGSRSEANFEVSVAQRFTTGSNPNEYTLSSVELKSADTEGDVFSVSVCEVDVDGYPTSTCTDFDFSGKFPGEDACVQCSGRYHPLRKYFLRAGVHHDHRPGELFRLNRLWRGHGRCGGLDCGG